MSTTETSAAPAWQQAFRAHFPIVKERVYACQAYCSPIAPRVSNAVQQFFANLSMARADKPEWLAAAEGVRAQVAKLINGQARHVAFTKNTTEGLNIVAQGFPWQPGDNMVLDDQEHPVNAVPWLNLRHRQVQVRVAPTQDRRVTVDSLWSQVDDRTRIVAVSYVQYSTGVRADIETLARKCKEKGIFLVVDGIQAVGLLPTDVQWGIGALSCGAYKALHGPLGLGFLYVNPELLALLQPAHLGPSYANSIDRKQPGWAMRHKPGDARILEGGNINYPAIAGFAQALLMIDEAQVERMAPWTLALGARLDAGMRAEGVEVLSSPVEGEQSSIVCIRHPQAFALRKHMYAHGVVCNLLDTGSIRFSFGAYNNAQEVDHILALTAQFMRDPSLRSQMALPTGIRR
ncbi:aminotransferase class V-fold PLP-dependent enzyme [Lampropedia puyangensis]|uniref:Aminotransferase class V-fold PLP-dependent enzyme n=1 Tax=Lampropedia puyangensis TaxID=1330072 RepID=A0A4S8FCX6_9BURK|nr:aminotransferase class V-fold PLP-dependent enzyme [Lampropedia puyangensis]THU05159.1 aminotransferase class V-fold PLP-dependent enzyme [Lampropedia puyangensis]